MKFNFRGKEGNVNLSLSFIGEREGNGVEIQTERGEKRTDSKKGKGEEPLVGERSLLQAWFEVLITNCFECVMNDIIF
jgi:hypothetical protein